MTQIANSAHALHTGMIAGTLAKDAGDNFMANILPRTDEHGNYLAEIEVEFPGGHKYVLLVVPTE